MVGAVRTISKAISHLNHKNAAGVSSVFSKGKSILYTISCQYITSSDDNTGKIRIYYRR